MMFLLILTWLQFKQQVESFVHTEVIKKITDLHNKWFLISPVYFQNSLQRRNYNFSFISGIKDTKHDVTLGWNTTDQWLPQKASGSATVFLKCIGTSTMSLDSLGQATQIQKKKGKKEKQQEQQVDTGMQKSQQAAADAVSNLRGHAEG